MQNNNNALAYIYANLCEVQKSITPANSKLETYANLLKHNFKKVGKDLFIDIGFYALAYIVGDKIILVTQDCLPKSGFPNIKEIRFMPKAEFLYLFFAALKNIN